MTPAAPGRPDPTGGPGLADVLPAVARSLGVPAEPPGGTTGRPAPRLALPPAPRAVVVLVDGLGARLLERRRGHAPFLRSLTAQTLAVPCGFPTTTATSMATFGTGRHSGEHGLLGYEVLDPERDLVFNELSWEDGPVPERWQRHRTVFEEVVAAGVPVTRIGPGFFDGSGLTRAALRGGTFTAATGLQERIDATVAAIRSAPRGLVYLYWGEVDKVGHVHGCESWQWGEELEAVDRALLQLRERLPSDCSLTVTADHGMVDVPPSGRLDLALTPGLADGIRHVSGEPRALQLHCAEGARADVVATWREVLGHRAEVVTREDAIAGGLFGPVDPVLVARIGDVIALSAPGHCVVDSRRHRPELIRLLGLHGAVTDDETLVPVVHLPAPDVA